MTKEEAKTYAQKLLKDSGASDEEVTQYLKLLDNDKFAQGFVPRPEVDRALTSERSKSEDAIKRNNYLEQEWLPQAKTAYEKNLKGIKSLEKYQELYGPIDDSDPDAAKRAAKAIGLDESKVRELLQTELNDRLAARDRATIELMDLREEYMDTFKKRMNVKDFEKFVGEQQKSGDFQGLRAAFRDFIEPDAKKLNDSALEARIKQERADAVKDFQSRNHIPADSKPKEPHLLFDRDALKGDKSKDGKPNGQSGREAFLEVLNDPEPDTVRNRYPV